MNKLKNIDLEKNLELAQSGNFHDLYPILGPNFVPYFNDERPAYEIGLILRARGGLLNINGRAFKDNTTGICSVCNLDEVENTHHLIGVCPIYSIYRTKYFGKRALDRNEVIDLLNGSDFDNLCKYLSDSLNCRELIVNEFA